MEYDRKLALFGEVLHSAEVDEVRRWAKGRPATPTFAAEVTGRFKDAVIAYFDFSSQKELGVEIAASLVLVRRRQRRPGDRPGHFAIAMREALLPSGEDESGEWEAMP